MKTSITVIGAVALAASAAASAETSEVRTRTVHFGDLNLASPEGVQQLYRRINAAAHEVCEVRFQGLEEVRRERTCRDESIKDAVAKIGNQQLIAYWEIKNGHVPLRLVGPEYSPEELLR